MTDKKKCARCGREINGEYFIGTSGPICDACLKENMVYYTLRSMGLLVTEEPAADNTTTGGDDRDTNGQNG